MWYEIFKFELKYRLKRADTYMFFLLLLLFSTFGVSFVFEGMDFGVIKKNSPIVIAKTVGAITGIFMILASMIMGVPVLRDFQYQMESLIFVNPLKKRDYLLGRFLGSFVVLLFIFGGVFIGMIGSEYMPWQNPDDYLAFSLLPYVHVFFVISLPTLFFAASLFFVSGTLSRNLMVVYTQGIVIFVLFILTKSIDNTILKSILDPFSLTTITGVTEHWSIAERTSNLIPVTGVLIYNKLFWITLGLISLYIGYYKFNFNVLKSSNRTKKKHLAIAQQKQEGKQPVAIPKVKIQRGFKAQWTQLINLTWFYFRDITRQASFWAIVICAIIIIIVNSVSLGTVYGVDSHPATYFIVEELQEMSLYFFIIILLFYSGEVIWKESAAQFNLIYDATPISNLVSLASKYFGLLLVYVVLIIPLILSGILFQTFSGYYNYEPQVYLYGFFLEIFPFLILYTFLAFFVQILSGNKFVGIVLTVTLFIFINVLGVLGVSHDLLVFAGSPLGIYSSMNGYGHFLKPYLFIKIYWLLFGVLLVSMASMLTTRGVKTSLLNRIKTVKNRISKPLFRFSTLIVLLIMIVGGYIFYNTNIINTYWSSSQSESFRVSYEKTLKKFEYLPQPKIVDVKLNMELYPETRDYSLTGYYRLKNTTDIVIDAIHVQKLIDDAIILSEVSFSKEATVDDQYIAYHYYIYNLKKALHPGDSIQMNFKQTFQTNGFVEGNSNTKIVQNGTFITNDNFPSLGYSKMYELRDAEDRKDFGLEKRESKAKQDDEHALAIARSGSDSDGLTAEIVIGTSLDQTAIGPGTLEKTWVENNRNYFKYRMNKPMINFYAIVSARYEVVKDSWVPSNDSLGAAIDLEIYHHKEHSYNLDRMMASMKASFDYFSSNFSPYTYDVIRIMEFPRYEEFAQSFPTTVPFSEAIGFVLDIDDEKDVDMVFYITAHEVAHQWWGLQLEAANVKGQHMILETLAQYSALMVLRKKYSEEKVQQFLKMEQEEYLKGRNRDGAEEVALALVEGQEYIYYRKGVRAMYDFQKAIGEDKVNFALKKFIKDWKTQDGVLKKDTNRYSTTKDLIGYFREATPKDKQHLITELFETVTREKD